MTRSVECVKPRDSIQHARDVMEQRRVNQLPVIVNGHLEGIVTDRDLRDAYPSVFELSSEHPVKHPEADPDKIKVEEVMSGNVVSLGPKDTVEDAARLMLRERFGAVPIVEGKRLVGILARSDVLRAFVEVASRLGK
jgi:acetoin utilization protein AcuB